MYVSNGNSTTIEDCIIRDNGIGWRGTYAAGKYFDDVVHPNIEEFTYTWIIVKWEDTNNDGFVNAPGEGDTYTILARGH